ncbi:acyl-CoA dehydrogenase family protein, partial [Streptomyces sp. SP18CM02]|nr:acyl-CoA dehydrogenase family protein [Streptomyces sp. SP18CM02]
LNTVGPTLMAYGTEEQKTYYLPRILTGHHDYPIGYSQPEAVTDIATLRTRAVRAGDHWVNDGQKIFTSNPQQADWISHACRTNADAPKHSGITINQDPTH